jgi:hypothetical protein
MKTIVNGVEITPKITEILSEWYYTDHVDTETRPEVYVAWLSSIQDGLTRQMLQMEDTSPATIRRYLSNIIYIKDELTRFIPDKKNEQSNETD